jgi:hypothetical protein
LLTGSIFLDAACRFLSAWELSFPAVTGVPPPGNGFFYGPPTKTVQKLKLPGALNDAQAL